MTFKTKICDRTTIQNKVAESWGLRFAGNGENISILLSQGRGKPCFERGLAFLCLGRLQAFVV